MGTCSNNVSNWLKFCQTKHFREHSVTFRKNNQQVLVREINPSDLFRTFFRFFHNVLKGKNNETLKNPEKTTS